MTTCDYSGPRCPTRFFFFYGLSSASPLRAFPSAIQPPLPAFGLLLAGPHLGILGILCSSTLFCSLTPFKLDHFLRVSARLPCRPSAPAPLYSSALTRGSLSSTGLEPQAPLTVYAGAGSKVELPCCLPPGVGIQSSLTAMWTPPGGGPDLLVAGDRGNFTLRLEAVGQAQAGTYTCRVHLQGRQLSATVTLAVITG